MRFAALLLCAPLLLLTLGAADDEAGFEPIFNGKTLDGWKSPDMSFWRVEDGAIAGEVTADRKPPENNFITWQNGTVDDFELRFRFRITGAQANSGMQFRSEVAGHGLVHGYQADMSGDGKWTGGIFDEYGRATHSPGADSRSRGRRTGRRRSSRFPAATRSQAARGSIKRSGPTTTSPPRAGTWS